MGPVGTAAGLSEVLGTAATPHAGAGTVRSLARLPFITLAAATSMSDNVLVDAIVDVGPKDGGTAAGGMLKL